METKPISPDTKKKAPPKIAPISVRVAPPKNLRALKSACKRRGISLSAAVNEAIERWLEDHKAAAPPVGWAPVKEEGMG